ncbi:MAG: hypothetical protein BRC24_02320 [Parcubacteria group bacterium SW_4_46_8]|nr:MAG: hypothetical protein BRC24_02320 [Parcubacteria group bacterium SW_4_46_8]
MCTHQKLLPTMITYFDMRMYELTESLQIRIDFFAVSSQQVLVNGTGQLVYVQAWIVLERCLR